MQREHSRTSRLLDRLQSVGHAPVIAPQRRVDGRLDVDVPGGDGWGAAVLRVFVPVLVTIAVMAAFSHAAGSVPSFIYAEF